MNRKKSIIVLITLLFFFINTGFAATCDTACQIKQSQLQAMEKQGLKSSPILEPERIVEPKKKPAFIEPEPFKIPPPAFSQTKKETVAGDTTTEKKTAPQNTFKPVNIFAPTQPTADANTQNQEEQEFVMQPPKSPLLPQPITKQTTGIQYH